MSCSFVPVPPGQSRPAEGRPWGSLDGPGQDTSAIMDQESPQGLPACPDARSIAGQHPLDAAARKTEMPAVTDLKLIDVTAVRVPARYFVELTFADGAERVVDLEPRLWGSMFKPVLADYGLFRQVTVDHDAGTIVWPDEADISRRTLDLESTPSMPATVTNDGAHG